MSKVTCKSGLEGWQGRLQDQYGSFGQFRDYDEMYGLVARLGHASAQEAWDDNPIVQGSTNPDDYCRVLTPLTTPVYLKVIVELEVDICDNDKSAAEWEIRGA